MTLLSLEKKLAEMRKMGGHDDCEVVQVSAMVDFVYMGIQPLSPSQRVEFLQGLAGLFCPHCGNDQEISAKCKCWNDE